MTGRLAKQQSIILAVLTGSLIVALVLRMLPYLSMDFATFAVHGDPDVWYNFRQIEVMVSDFPRYNWFDPMTGYPTGKYIDWGPLFPMIASALCIVTGAVLRVDFIAVSSFIPILFGVLMVPVVYFLGRQVAGWKAGIIGAVFIAVVSGEYFYRTMAGVVDHHCAEILFTTLFCLFVLFAVRKAAEQEVDIRNPASYKPILIPSVLAGIALAAGMAVVMTVLLFAMILSLYTLLQYTWNAFHETRTDYLLIINGIVSAFAIAGLWIIGIHSPVYSLATYSLAPVHAFILLFCSTALLQVFSIVFRGKPWIFSGVILACLIGCIIGVIFFSVPFLESGYTALSSFFGQSFHDFPIDEQKPWSPAQMWGSYNIGIIMAFIGILLIAHRFWKRECPVHLFVLVWGMIVLISTALHSRFAYYSAVFVVLSAAVALSYAFVLDEPRAGKKISGTSSRDRKGKDAKRKRDNSFPDARDILSRLEGTGTSLVLACMVMFCGISMVTDYSMAANTKNTLIPQQWTETLEWMEGNAAETGVAYLGPYEGSGWTYPPGTTSILSWWDYGHWITFLSKRIPVANPFQDNVGLSSLFFFVEDESVANRITDRVDARYIITDWMMTDSKFPSMVTWYQSSFPDVHAPDNYFYQVFRVAPGKANQTQISLNFPPYYRTMASRLQNFDGSMVEPREVVYVEYAVSQSRSVTPIVYRYEVLGIDAARENLAAFTAAPHEGKGAAIGNTGRDDPVETIDALQHYRLIYEQADDSASSSSGNTHTVKVFEYVRGAKLQGEGRIEVTIETNTGRTFVYTQESKDGHFLLPYATKNAPYPVKTTGPYRLVSSAETIEVSEQEIMEGATITG